MFPEHHNKLVTRGTQIYTFTFTWCKEHLKITHKNVRIVTKVQYKVISNVVQMKIGHSQCELYLICKFVILRQLNQILKLSNYIFLR